MTLDLSALRQHDRLVGHDELWFWQNNTFGIFGLYTYVELITGTTKPSGFRTPKASSTVPDKWLDNGPNRYGIYTPAPGGEANWVRVPFGSLRTSSGEAITEADLENIKAIKFALPINLT